ncbi:nuclear transport factor 2 family protein [Bradyrhizobium sp. Pha-3]|uniref:nuclear transport factor 2 family protein n=1 Tax=Bradyrhizobium sp. Pha-3 TaxID=208375 RepID=UPI0035D4E35B
MNEILTKARLTVDELLERRHGLQTYEERVQHALDLVHMHFEAENPERIDECIRLYTGDAEWEAPARRISYKGPQKIKEMYLRLFASAHEFSFTPIERWATPDRVLDDSVFTFQLAGDGFENAPLPIGTRVRMRLIHNFHIRDGMIAKEIGYEIWSKDH